MAKKAKKKGGAKKTKEKINPREAFMEARLEFRQQQIKAANRELREQEEDLQFMLARVADSDQYRTNTINGILNKLHQVEKNLGETSLNNESQLKNLEALYKGKVLQRQADYEAEKVELDRELARNEEIEEEIKEWAEYKNVGSQLDALKIDELETELAKHIEETEGVISFIKNQIQTGKDQLEGRIRAVQEKTRHTVFDEAIRCTSPGAFYECQESERLQTYCDEHVVLLSKETEIHQKLHEKKNKLEEELRQLKRHHPERPKQMKPVLDGSFFITT